LRIQPEDLDSGNEADTVPKIEKEYLWKLKPLVTSIDKLNFNNTANVEGEWVINKNLDLTYFSVLASDSVLSDTSTDVDNDPLSVINVLISLHAPIRSSLMVHEKTNDEQGAFFEVPAKHRGQKPILFWRIKPEPIARESLKDNAESP